MSVAVLREVRLYGPLRARFGRSHWLAVETPAEAVRALSVLLKGFREAFLGHSYHVVVGEGERARSIGENAVQMKVGQAGVIRIAPVLHGRKNGWLQVVAGYIVFALGVYFRNPSLVALGEAMILGGAVNLLSPQRAGSGSQAEKETSFAFGGPVNVNSPGGPVPLIIGRMIVGSVVVSAGLSTDDYTPPAVSQPSDPQRPADEPIDWLDLNAGS